MSDAHKRNLAVPFFTQRDNTYVWQQIDDDDNPFGPKYPMAWRSCNITSLCMILHYFGITDDSPDDYFAYNGLKFSKLDTKLTDGDLRDLDKAQLRLMRNAVYARHGRTFRSVDLQSLWNCYTWYKVNPNYSDDLLTEVDIYNIKLIQQHEAQR